MMQDEFNRISGAIVDPVMYEEIEFVYMTFDEITKQEISSMYWNNVVGGYDLWLRAKDLAKDLECARRRDDFFQTTSHLNVWNSKKEELIREIKKMKVT